MGVRKFWLCLIVMLVGCSTSPTNIRIALLAPFEGRYREIGYDAYYAAQLAFTDESPTNISLLAVDDGGSVISARERARAIQQDPSIGMVVLIGTFATDSSVQTELGDIPAVIIGDWHSTPQSNTISQLSNPQINTLAEPIANIDQINPAIDWISSEILALNQIPSLYPQRGVWTIVSSSTLPDEGFVERYRELSPFTPEPGLLATLTYDGFRMAIQSLQQNLTIDKINYEGINGRIQIANRYWLDAPIYRYRYLDDQLQPNN